jgi:hypothetical protein
VTVIFDRKLNGCLVEVSILRIYKPHGYNAKLKPQEVRLQLTKTLGVSLHFGLVSTIYIDNIHVSLSKIIIIIFINKYIIQRT